MAEYRTRKFYWLKLKDDFFKDKEIKKLRKIAGGDTYTIIYLKLMLLALKDEGKLYFEGIEDSFAEEIALELDEDTDNVKVTLLYLNKMGLLEEVTESEFMLTRLPELVGTQTEGAAKKALQRKRRQEMLPAQRTESGQVVDNCPPEIRDKREENKREDIREKREEIDYQLIADMYNEICISFPRIRSLSEARKKAIKARINSGYTVDDIKEIFTRSEASTFLKGGNERNWSATFDWMLKDANAAKILDGNYDNKAAGVKNAVNGAVETINGKAYIKKNGKYYLANGSGIPVDPFAEDDLPF